MKRVTAFLVIAFMAFLAGLAPPASASEYSSYVSSTVSLAATDDVNADANKISISDHVTAAPFTVASEPVSSPSGVVLVGRNTAGSDANFVFLINTDANGNLYNKTFSPSEAFTIDASAVAASQPGISAQWIADFGAPAEITNALHTATTNYHPIDGFVSLDVQLLE